jgi:hypothetical protein
MEHKSLLLPIHNDMFITVINVKEGFKPTKTFHNQVKASLAGKTFTQIRKIINESKFKGHITVSKVKKVSSKN